MQAEEILTDYEICKLALNNKVPKFDCGDEDLNDFIINDAPLYRIVQQILTSTGSVNTSS